MPRKGPRERVEFTLRTLLHTRPVTKVTVLYVAGILLGRHASVPVVPLFAAALIVSILAAVISRSSNERQQIWLALLISIAVTLGGVLKITVDRRLLPDTHVVRLTESRERIALHGTVTSAPRIAEYGLRFIFRSEGVYRESSHSSAEGDVLVFLRLRDDPGPSMPEIAYGDRLMLHGRLERPSTARNPGEFDFRSFLEVNGIYATISIRDAEDVQRLGSGGGGWFQRALLVPIRRQFVELVDTTIEGDEAEFFKGLVIGDRQGISTEWKEAFIDAGVMHVLAVSGLHVGIVAGMFFAFAGLIRLPRFWRIAATVVGLVFYAALTGFAPPVLRATIMAVVVLFGSLLERRVDPYHSLAAAALIMLFVDARQLFDPGFQLSFAAAFSIIYTYPKWSEMSSRLPTAFKKNVLLKGGVNLIVLSLAAQLGTLPFILLYFGKLSVVALAVNLVVLPLVALTIPLGFLMLLSNLLSPSLAGLYGEAARLLLSLMMFAVSVAAHFRWSSVTLPALGTNAVFCYYGLLLSAIRWNFRLARRTAVFVTLASLTIVIWTVDVTAIRSRTMSVTVLDVSQGDAIYVEFPFGQTMLIDAGPRSLHSDAGKERIVPFLEKRGIQFIDAVILTHPHSDHLGGLATILSSVRVGRVVYSGRHVESDAFERFVAAARSYSVPLQTVEAGDTLDGFTMARCYVLHPAFESLDQSFRRLGSSLNDGSVVLKLLYGKTSFLFAGDVERNGERQLLGRYGNFLDSDVLKVAHHGSESSSTQSFLGIVSPHTAIVSVGRFNLFGHPSQDVLSRLREQNIQVHRTDLEGAVVVHSDGERALVADWH